VYNRNAMELLNALLDERTTNAEATLAAAIRLDLHTFLGIQIEARMRARPRFLGRTPRDLLVEIRKDLDVKVGKATEDLMKAMLDLRMFLAANPKPNREEGEAVINAVSERAIKLARGMLVGNFFPGDDVPDDAKSDVVDDAPKYQLDYTPTVPLIWAWTQVRELDRVRIALDAARGGKVADSYELRRHLPEALPEQTW
jgi:hypothetical protein